MTSAPEVCEFATPLFASATAAVHTRHEDYQWPSGARAWLEAKHTQEPSAAQEVSEEEEGAEEEEDEEEKEVHVGTVGPEYRGFLILGVLQKISSNRFEWI